MKIKKGFSLRQVVNSWVVLPLADDTVSFSGMLTLNDAGAMLWKVLEQGGDRAALVSALTAEYDVSAQQAAVDVDEFLQKLVDSGCVEL